MENLCKLCLEISDDLLDILQDNPPDFNIKDIISNYIDCDLNKNYQLNKICSICWHKFKNFHQFLLMIKEKQNNISMILEKLPITIDEKNIKIFKSEPEEESVSESLDLEQDHTTSNLVELIKFKEQPKLKGKSKAVSTINSSKKKNESRSKKLEIQSVIEEEESLIESFYDLTCDLCFQILENFDNYFNHYKETHNISGYIICCKKKFTKRSSLAEHVLYHTKPELFKCLLCGNDDIYETKKILSKHILEKHTPKDSPLYKCDVCNKVWQNIKSLNSHKLTHLDCNEKQFICTDCKKPFGTLVSLEAHKRAIHSLKYLKICEICGRKYKSKVFFEKHQLEHKGISLPKIQCKICTVWLKNEYSLRQHSKLHTDTDIIHKCELCGKICPSRNAILKHKRFVHFRQRIHVCITCDKSFKTSIALKEHISTHTGELLYTCPYCPKQFRSGANYHAHRKRKHFEEWCKERQEKLEINAQKE